MGAHRRPGQVVVAFALETSGGVDAARRKLAGKKADFIVMNNPTQAGSEFGGPTNRVTIVTADGGADERPLESKREAARAILDRVAALLKPPAGGKR